jgi:hypothetical protein
MQRHCEGLGIGAYKVLLPDNLHVHVDRRRMCSTLEDLSDELLHLVMASLTPYPWVAGLEELVGYMANPTRQFLSFTKV